MKIKCSIKWKYNKKANVWILLSTVLSLVLWQAAHISFVAVPIFVVALSVILNLEITLDERLPWIWMGLLFGGGSILTMYSIQYLLLEQEFRKTTIKRVVYISDLSVGADDL